MKKNRLATKLSALVSMEKIEMMADIIFKETSSIGLRLTDVDRIEARREIKNIKTKYGLIKVKLAYQGDDLVNISPEYDDCARIAQKKKISFKKVHQEAVQKAYKNI